MRDLPSRPALVLVGLLPVLLGGAEPDPAPREPAPVETVEGCHDDHRAVFFHGLGARGAEIETPALCVPRIDDDGPQGFWSSVAFVRAPASDVVAGFSAGRIPVLRRLASGLFDERTAVLLDPSWADGARYDGRTGPEIVSAWLAADRSRTFVLVYAPGSGGWREYTALTASTVGAQVKLCAVDAAHLEVPAAVGPSLLLDTEAWTKERCRAP